MLNEKLKEINDKLLLSSSDDIIISSNPHKISVLINRINNGIDVSLIFQQKLSYFETHNFIFELVMLTVLGTIKTGS